MPGVGILLEYSLRDNAETGDAATHVRNSGDDPECNPQAVKHSGFEITGIDFFGNNLLLS